MSTVAFIGHPDFQLHDTGHGHPERPARLAAIHDRLGKSGLAEELVSIEPRFAEESWLEKAHAAAHVANVKARAQAGHPSMEDYETMLCGRSFDIARRAVGATFDAVDAVASGKTDYAFCAVRPPGHHAEYDRAMGFCLFNNVVIAARYIQETCGLDRVLILDWDVHHGNGTQHILEDDPTVFYCSIHQYPHYPGTGAAEETGIGEGKGYTLNVPVPGGAGDAEFTSAIDDRLASAMDGFKPQFVIISAGFDAHVSDPLSMTRVTEDGFVRMTKSLMAIARDHADGRLISVLEGGYDLNGLASSVEAHLRALLDG